MSPSNDLFMEDGTQLMTVLSERVRFIAKGSRGATIGLSCRGNLKNWHSRVERKI